VSEIHLICSSNVLLKSKTEAALLPGSLILTTAFLALPLAEGAFFACSWLLGLVRHGKGALQSLIHHSLNFTSAAFFMPLFWGGITMADSGGIREALLKAAVEVTAYYKELHGESPRASVILAVAALEDELQTLILLRFPPSITEPTINKLFGPGLTPFGAFASKADVAQAFGYYGPETRKQLELIGSIRNKFAHSGRVIDFHNEKVFAKCQSLGITRMMPGETKPNQDDIRDKFINLVSELHTALEERTHHLPELREQQPPELP
jgi:hypothetical protein